MLKQNGASVVRSASDALTLGMPSQTSSLHCELGALAAALYLSRNAERSPELIVTDNRFALASCAVKDPRFLRLSTPARSWVLWLMHEAAQAPTRVEHVKAHTDPSDHRSQLNKDADLHARRAARGLADLSLPYSTFYLPLFSFLEKGVWLEGSLTAHFTKHCWLSNPAVLRSRLPFLSLPTRAWPRLTTPIGTHNLRMQQKYSCKSDPTRFLPRGRPGLTLPPTEVAPPANSLPRRYNTASLPAKHIQRCA